ncbi:MAG TPA: hypothetical protein VM243_08105 [Phycisphaerae bacterium]|nr:hypothetical protein [Phycisphaerae bacterium]
MNGTRRRKPALTLLAVVLGSAALAGAVYWSVHSGGPALEDDLASGDADRMRAALLSASAEEFEGEEARERRRLTIEAMKQMPIEDLFDLWRGNELSNEERELLGRNMRSLWMEHMNDLADDYFTASPEEKVAILDRQIDDWKSFMDRMQKYREEHRDDPEDEQQREEERRRWRNPSKEDRKEQMTQTDPDQQAKMFYMFRKMGERAEERGVDFGWSRGRGGENREQTGGRQRDSGRDRDRDRGGRGE